MESTIIKYNPDENVVKEVKQRLKDNGGYCPCAIVHNKDTRCMCYEFRNLIEEGYCHCGLYHKTKINIDKKGN